MSAADFANMLKIVVSIMSRNESKAFHEPVDWKALGLVDYPDIVKRPMDLGTIKKKLENGSYNKIDDVANDIRLVWTNCMLYNRDGSEFYHLASAFAKHFEEAYATLRRLVDSTSDLGRVPTLEERMQLSHDVFKLDNTELARVLTIIEASSPNALARKSSSDEVLINLDALQPTCFHEVNAYVIQCLINNDGKKKRKLITAETTKKTTKK